MKRNTGISSPKVKTILFTIVLLFLILPGIQGRYSLIGEKKLTGAFKETKKPDFKEFTWESWLNGTFQEDYNNRLEQHIGFRNTLVRVNNQLGFSLFGQANAEGVLVGTDNELFEEDYIKEYLGQYFVGDTVWSKKALKLRAVQDTLSKLGKTLVVVFEPGKGSFYADKLPLKYRNIKKTVSNYEELSGQLKKAGVNVLDLNQYFLTIKDKTEYPLFPQCGTHWSYYGAALAADTTLRYLETLRGTNLPDMKILRNEVLDTTRHPDYDIGLAMNLLIKIPHPKTANPVIRFQRNNNTVRLNALVVGDSFYFNWLNNRIPTEAFNSCDFWYYNKKITRSDGSEAGEANEMNFQQEVLKKDIIMIMITERFMHTFAWGFDEQLYDLFFPGKRDPVEVFSNTIRTYGDEFKRMYEESLEMNISLPDRIKQEAGFLFYKDYKNNPDKYTEKRDLLLVFEMGIRGTPAWLEDIRRKAKNNNVSIDEQIRIDAAWIYEEKYGKKQPE